VLTGSRWDDAAGRFTTLYCATTAVAAFGEAIAAFRERPGLLARIDAYLTGPPDAEYDPELPAAVVPADYLSTRLLGHAPTDQGAPFIDVDHVDTHLHASSDSARLLRKLRLPALDRGVLMGQDRRITRTVATYYHRYARVEENRSIRGLRYQSRLDGGWECWAMWRPLPFVTAAATLTAVTSDNPDLVAAARRLRLRLPGEAVTGDLTLGS
jgi:hypothetical protein